MFCPDPSYPFPANGLPNFARSLKLVRVLADSERWPISVKSDFHICSRIDVRPVALALSVPIFGPSEMEKVKIQGFIESFRAEVDDSSVEDMVDLAKAVYG